MMMDDDIVPAGESIASEGSGEYMLVEGYVRSTDGKPIANAVIETWETDSSGMFWRLRTPARACSSNGILKTLSTRKL